MVKRIVKLTFREDAVSTFLETVFEPSAPKIRAFEGCQHMELLRDTSKQNVLFTMSIWDSESHLESYRNSELFQSTWAKTKVLFDDKPQAWTVEVIG